MDKHIVVLGGGGWMMGEKHSKLDRYALDLTGKREPKVCYLSTATGDAEEAIQRFYDSGLSCNLTHFPLFKPDSNWRTKLQEQDVIYVGGGNTRSMLAIWREWGIDTILKECYENGVVLCGMSAGAICWFDLGITDSNPEEYTVIDGLGFVRGLASAHFNGSDEKADLFSDFSQNNSSVPCYGISDYAALHFVNGQLYQMVTSKFDAKVTFENAL